ncbi:MULTISPECIES: hypothetical protein [unclassified Serratia (in: enterobacteria)]|uniref:hypothetical protein n=1 Tax=unclassified Serratia (in: enterobacteria) TaxID=2647522 RepID=UPI000A7F7A2F|nr:MULTISPECIES: hypothetical protein [unclassified Serratia (in: enterobacteria)]
MSKTAINALTKAAHIAKCDSGFLTGFITDKAFRKAGKWRNADALAALIINSVANAFQCECSSDMQNAGGYYNNMQEAIEGYVQANMDDWNGDEWSKKDLAAELARLAEMVERNAIFEAHTAALVINSRLDTTKRTVLGKVVSGATKHAESYGRFYVGYRVSHIDIDCAKSYGGTLSTNDMKHECYSVAAFK